MSSPRNLGQGHKLVTRPKIIIKSSPPAKTASNTTTPPVDLEEIAKAITFLENTRATYDAKINKLRAKNSLTFSDRAKEADQFCNNTSKKIIQTVTTILAQVRDNKSCSPIELELLQTFSFLLVGNDKQEKLTHHVLKETANKKMKTAVPIEDEKQNKRLLLYVKFTQLYITSTAQDQPFDFQPKELWQLAQLEQYMFTHATQQYIEDWAEGLISMRNKKIKKPDTAQKQKVIAINEPENHQRVVDESRQAEPTISQSTSEEKQRSPAPTNKQTATLAPVALSASTQEGSRAKSNMFIRFLKATGRLFIACIRCLCCCSSAQEENENPIATNKTSASAASAETSRAIADPTTVSSRRNSTSTNRKLEEKGLGGTASHSSIPVSLPGAVVAQAIENSTDNNGPVFHPDINPFINKIN